MNSRRTGLINILLFFIIIAMLTGFIPAVDSGTGEVCSAAAATAPVDDLFSGSDYVEGQLLVRFKPEAADNFFIRTMAHARIGAGVVKDFSPMEGLQLVKLPEGLSVAEAVEKYNADSHVLYAEPDYIYRVQHCNLNLPDDPFYELQWGLNNTGQEVSDIRGTPGADIGANEAWKFSTGSENVVIAVIDTGVDYNHEDLRDNMWENRGIRGVNYINNSNDPMDDNGHGTHVAGIIASQGNNGIGGAGVMWDVSIMPLKFMNSNGIGSLSNAIKAIQFATANGADIINLSWGGDNFSYNLKDAILESPALFVCAAGNESSERSFYPAGYNCPNIISVAASDQKDRLAGFSNYGTRNVHLAAPGVNIKSTFAPVPDYTIPVFSDDFNSLDNWETGDFIHNEWGLSDYRFVSPSFAVTDSPGKKYANDETSWLRLKKPVDLSDVLYAEIGFDLWHETEKLYDRLELIVNYFEDDDSFKEIVYSWFGSSDGIFEPVKIDLSDYCGAPRYISFRFITDRSVVDTGVYIDNFEIYTSNNLKYDQYHYLNGTSMATPHVAGVAGLLKSALPELSSVEIKDIILETVDLIPELENLVSTGGRLNAFAALDSVLDPEPFLLGDVSGNNTIDVGDAILILRHIVGLQTLESCALSRAMVSGEDVLTVQDAILILRFIVGVITEFPADILYPC